MERLISIREYVLRFDKPIGFYADKLDYYEGQSNAMSYVISYANLLSKKLELWMFVPCKFVEGVWVVLEEPKENDLCGSFFDMQTGFHYEKEYQEAKDMVLFANFKYDKMGFAYSVNQSECGFDEEYMESKTIEDLVKYNLELTPTAKKQIGL